MLVVDIFDDRALFQLGHLQATLQSPILLPQPLLIDQQPKTLFEAELMRLGSFELSSEGIGHTVEFHGL
jgi:hypothetical protein